MATVLGWSLFSSEVVLSSPSADVASQFLYARAFGFGELAQGHLPLWNPYIYSGVPFLGDFQSALLYPPNLIFLVLPLATAINWSFGLHVFLLGAFTYAWMLGRSLRPAAAFVAGVAAMFSGTFFLHIYAGHLSNVCAMAWPPLIFLGIDRWLRTRHLGWIFLAATAAALQIYAGHPQYVYYTAMVAGLYSLVHLPGTSRLPMAAVGLLAIYPLAALLAAAQLLPGLSAAAESVRSGGTTYAFSSMFSFPPENFLTLFAPWLFGGHDGTPYWGRCYLWEMSVYSGSGMLLIAATGIFQPGERSTRIRLLILLGATVLLALGMHTPLHRLLYEILPGFSSFRGSSKFIYFTGLFIAVFAGMGMDRLLKGEKPQRILGITGLTLGFVMLVIGFGVSGKGSLLVFHSLIEAILRSQESYLNPAALENQNILLAIQATAVGSLKIAGVLWMLLSSVLLLARRWTLAAWVLGVMAVVEVCQFARGTIESFPLEEMTYPPITNFLKNHPGDYRVLNTFNPDASMLLRKGNIWGYDPSVLKRYAEMMFASQGLDPKEASQYLPIRSPHPLFAMLRCKMAFLPETDGRITIKTLAEPFPHFYLVSKYRVLKNSDAMLAELQSPLFDLRREILLEEEPFPAPDPGEPEAEIRVIDSSTDHWTLEINTDRAALLVIPDAWSRDWRAAPLDDSVQTAYSILPANHALRAIPLAAGHHHLRMEYIPTGFQAGIAISLVTWSSLAITLGIPSIRRRLAIVEHPKI
jgi:hypothetical protein